MTDDEKRQRRLGLTILRTEQSQEEWSEDNDADRQRDRREHEHDTGRRDPPRRQRGQARSRDRAAAREDGMDLAVRPESLRGEGKP